MLVYLLVYTFATTLAEQPTVLANCEQMTFDQAHQFILDYQKRTSYIPCEKREGIYEWMCNNNNTFIWVHTIKKDPEDCRTTPSRTLNNLRMLMKKPTL